MGSPWLGAKTGEPGPASIVRLVRFVIFRSIYQWSRPSSHYPRVPILGIRCYQRLENMRMRGRPAVFSRPCFCRRLSPRIRIVWLRVALPPSFDEIGNRNFTGLRRPLRRWWAGQPSSASRYSGWLSYWVGTVHHHRQWRQFAWAEFVLADVAASAAGCRLIVSGQSPEAGTTYISVAKITRPGGERARP